MNPQFFLIPGFPADETINSFLGRTAGYNSGGTLRMGYSRFFDRRRFLLDTIPCSVGRFCEVLDNAFGDARQVIQEHTLFDFYACGLHTDKIAIFMDRVIATSLGPTRPTRLPLFLDCSEQLRPHCPECDEQNIRRYGFQFLYRQHTVPYVEVCPWHRTPLRTKVEELNFFHDHCRQAQAGKFDLIQEYAVRASRAVTVKWPQSAYQRDAIIRQLKTERWISRGGRCKCSEFLTAFHKKFDGAFRDERLVNLCSEPRYAEAALRAMLRSDRNVHPIWSLLFKWLADEIECPVSSAERKPNAKAAVAKPSHEQQLAVLRSSTSVRQASKILQLSEQTLLSVAKKSSIKVKTRPKRIYAIHIDRIQKQLRKSISPVEIASANGVSLSTVYRVRDGSDASEVTWRSQKSSLRLQQARAAWLSAIQDSPSALTTQIRRQHPADWSYLYKNDKEWLDKNSLHQSRTSRCERRGPPTAVLSIAAKTLLKAADVCSGFDNLPVRRSAYRLAMISGFSEYQLSRLLKTSGESIPESQSSFVARRLHWIVGKSPEAAHQPVWRVAKKSSIRASSIEVLIYTPIFYSPQEEL